MTVDKQSEYAVYRGDDLIVIGTAKECAAEMGVTPKYIRWMATPAAEMAAEALERAAKA
jgi:hypothetical protein